VKGWLYREDPPQALKQKWLPGQRKILHKRGGDKMSKDVMIVTGAGQISMAIARRMGYGKKIILGDKNEKNALAVAQIMNQAGFDVEPFVMDMSSRNSIQAMVQKATEYGEVKALVCGAGVSPSQAPIEVILQVDLYGTSVLMEEVSKVIAKGGAGVIISSQSGHRLPALTPEQDRALAMTPTEELLKLDFLQPEKIKDTLHAYQLAKRCNEKRTMYEAVRWGERGARINDIAPGIIVTPLAIDEFNGPRGEFYKNMFAKCPAGRPGTADEVADVAELLMSERAQFITGSTFLVDGGATASYYYGPLQP
jgi:NAD(P)-dependent dehydrogenase (short-subunit alcohol dehydrogenase family)